VSSRIEQDSTQRTSPEQRRGESSSTVIDCDVGSSLPVYAVSPSVPRGWVRLCRCPGPRCWDHWCPSYEENTVFHIPSRVSASPRFVSGRTVRKTLGKARERELTLVNVIPGDEMR
jgi:hypothetical protein